MKPPPSLLARIVLRLSLATLFAIICAYGWLWWEFQNTTGSLRDKSLIEMAHRIARSVVLDTNGEPSLHLSSRLRDAFVQSKGTHGFAVRERPGGHLLFAAGAEVGPIPPGVQHDEDGSLYQYNPDGPGPTSYFGEAFPFDVGGRPLIVQVVRLSSDYQDLLETVLGDFFEDGGWLAGPFLLLLLLISILTVRGTLGPLRSLSRRVETIGPTATDVRLPLTDLPREILPLVKAVNRAFDRLDEGFRLQREFTANAAHELRTPLAVLTAHVDTLDDREAAKALRQDLEGMAHLVEQLLCVARAEALALGPDDRADLCAIARDVAAYLAPMAIHSGRMLEVDAPDYAIAVPGHEDSLFHAVRNLVDNALRYTPVGTSVIIGVSESPPQVTVRDWGPGVPTEKRDAVFRRFWRADRRASGAGLGLSIVQRTMDGHHGTIVYEDAEGGGALFRLIFPSP